MITTRAPDGANNQRKQGWLKFFIPILDPGSGWSWIQIDNYFRPIWPKLLPGGWDPWRGGEARRGGRWTSCLGKQDWVPPLLPQVWKLHNCSSTKLSDIYLSIQRMYTHLHNTLSIVLQSLDIVCISFQVTNALKIKENLPFQFCRWAWKCLEISILVLQERWRYDFHICNWCSDCRSDKWLMMSRGKAPLCQLCWN